MIYLVNKLQTNININKGRYVIKPLGWITADDTMAEDPDVVYAKDREWLEVTTKKPKTPAEGVPPAVMEFFDPNSGLTHAELKEMLDKQREKYTPRFIHHDIPEDPLEDKTVIPKVSVAKTVEIEDPLQDKTEIPKISMAKKPDEIDPSEVKGALGKTEEPVKKPRTKKTEGLEEFS